MPSRIFYTERTLKDGKETGEIRILKFKKNGRPIVASELENNELWRIVHLTLLGFSDEETYCRTNVQAGLSDAITQPGLNGTLAPHLREEVQEYTGGVISVTPPIKIPFTCVGAEALKAHITSYEKTQAEEYRAKHKTEAAVVDNMPPAASKSEVKPKSCVEDAMVVLAAAAAAAKANDNALSTDSLPPAAPMVVAAAAGAAAPTISSGVGANADRKCANYIW